MSIRPVTTSSLATPTMEGLRDQTVFSVSARPNRSTRF